MTAALPKSIRLRTLNALLASMVGTAPQLRSDVDAVLRVFEADDETDPRLNATDLAAAAAQIFRLLSPDRPVPTVAVLDHRAEPFDALWAHERVEAALATTGKPPTCSSGSSACRISILPAPVPVRPAGVPSTTKPSIPSKASSPARPVDVA